MARPGGIASMEDRMVKVTANEFSALASSKQEVYRFLATEVGAYLDSYATMTVWHLRDLMAGKRKLIKSKDIKYLHVPLFEGLSSADML